MPHEPRYDPERALLALQKEPPQIPQREDERNIRQEEAAGQGAEKPLQALGGVDGGGVNGGGVHGDGVNGGSGSGVSTVGFNVGRKDGHVSSAAGQEEEKEEEALESTSREKQWELSKKFPGRQSGRAVATLEGVAGRSV